MNIKSFNIRKKFFLNLFVLASMLIVFQSCNKEEDPAVQCKNCTCNITKTDTERRTNQETNAVTTFEDVETSQSKDTYCSGMYKNTPYFQTLEFWESNPIIYSENTYTANELNNLGEFEEILVEETTETRYVCTCN